MSLFKFLKEHKFNLIGIIFIFWWLLDVYLKASYYGFFNYHILWICSLGLLLLGLAYLFESQLLFNIVLTIAILFQIPWTIDYIFIIIFKTFFSGDVSYIYRSGILDFIDTMKHLFMLPFAFYGWQKIKKSSKIGWLVALLFVIGTTSLALFSNPDDNINCAFKACLIKWPFNPIANQFIFWILIIMLVPITSLFLDKMIIKLKNKPFLNKKIFLTLLIIAIVFAIIGFIRLFLMT